MDLQAWNKALIERLRENADVRRLVYVYVDREVLVDVSGMEDPAEAVADFTSAFLAASGTLPFGRALSDARGWVRAGRPGDPPMVAALAMTVLAVTEDPLGASHNVYSRQNELLHRPPGGGAPPGYTEHVPELWRTWNEWLITDGSWLGRPSASAGKHFTYQGWARSQGLIRARDRGFMAEYFSEVRPESLVDLPPDLRALEFISWLTYRGPRTAQLRARLDGDAACQILSTVLADELDLWLQGTRRSLVKNRSGVPALLFYDQMTRELGLALEIDDRIVGSTVDLGYGAEVLAADEPLRILSTDLSSEALLGMAGQRLDLGGALMLKTRPKHAYVFRQDSQLAGRIEVRGDVADETYFVLAHDTIIDKVREALRLPASATTPGPCRGWKWLESAQVDAAAGDLRALGLGSLARPQSKFLTLQGGLQLTGRTYLQGGGPDVSVPQDHEVRLDGLDLAVGLHGQSSLRDVGVGDHLLEDLTTGIETRFTIARPARSRAQGSDESWPPTVEGPREIGSVVSGAAVSGGEAGTPALVAEVRAGDRVIVVDDDGGVFEVEPPRERWLARASINSYLIDVFRTVRTMNPRPAFVLVCSSKNRVVAVEVLAESRLSAGRVARTPVPDLRHLLYVPWTWVGKPAEGRRRSIVSGLVQTGAASSAAPARRSPVAPVAEISPRADLVDEPIGGNPYDVVLEWLSELERPRVSIDRFVATWRWACERSGLHEMGRAWRGALVRLRLLGHVERDFERRWVCVAQPTLALLPSSAGLRVLAGARPSTVRAWLDESADAPGALGDALMHLVTSTTTQVEVATGRPAGPTTLYMAASAGHGPVVARGMRDLGILVPDRPSSMALLAVSTGLPALQKDGQVFEIPPARQSQVWRPGVELGRPGTWVVSSTDAGRGFYRYVTSSRETVHAWRPGLGEPLVALAERSWGFWFEERAAGRTDRVQLNEGKRLLFVRASIPLPHLVERALVLRTGLLPTTCRVRDVDHNVYENVDRDLAEQVASRLGQQLHDTEHEESA